jgi:hypothetical protein
MFLNNKYFSFHIENPLKTWWRARKYFRFPRPSIQVFCSKWYILKHRLCVRTDKKILSIDISDLEWKDKFDSPRFEEFPYIFVSLFNFIGFSIDFSGITYKDELNNIQDMNVGYWEYLLSYLYYTHNLKDVDYWYRDSKVYKELDKIGTALDGSQDTYKYVKYTIPIVSTSLNKRGIKQLKKELHG